MGEKSIAEARFIFFFITFRSDAAEQIKNEKKKRICLFFPDSRAWKSDPDSLVYKYEEQSLRNHGRILLPNISAGFAKIGFDRLLLYKRDDDFARSML